MRRCLLVVALAAVLLVVLQAAALAAWIDDADATASYSTAALQPPTNPATAAGLCVPVVGDAIVVSWTVTPSGWADGYEVARSTTSGGPYSVVGTAAGQTTMSFTDSLLSFSMTYHYVVRATKGNWRSAYTAQVSRTTRSGLCL